MPDDRRCGTCQHWTLVQKPLGWGAEWSVGRCGWPAKNLCAAIKLVSPMDVTEGTDCPAWKPKEMDDAG